MLKFIQLQLFSLLLLTSFTVNAGLTCNSVFLDSHEIWKSSVAALKNATDIRLKQPFQFKTSSQVGVQNLKFPTSAEAYKDTVFLIRSEPGLSLSTGIQIYKKIEFGYQQKESYRRLGTVNYIAMAENGQNLQLNRLFQKGKSLAFQDDFRPLTREDIETVLLVGYLSHDFPSDEYKIEFNVKVRSSIKSNVEEISPVDIYKKSSGAVVAMAGLRTSTRIDEIQNYIFTRIGNYLRP